MPFKEYQLSNGRVIKVFKRRNSRNIKLSLTQGDKIRVSIPYWVPYAAGIKFAESRIGWIEQESTTYSALKDGQSIGKAHKLKFIGLPEHKKPTARVMATEVVVRHSTNLTAADQDVQQVAQKASVRALRQQAENLLPQRLRDLSSKYNFYYNDVKIKQLRGRWGSCDSNKNIVLNLYLMMLPWRCIDYVIIHELCHTRILKHGPEFWQEMHKYIPNMTEIRNEIKQYQPILAGTSD